MNVHTDPSLIRLCGQIVDVWTGKIFGGEVLVENGKIRKISPKRDAPPWFILPGFVDSHVHIESAMVTPATFGRIAPIWGTVATVSDPHEIANVLGKRGVYYMLEDALRTKLKIRFGVPSCVPATSFESAGGRITVADVEELMPHPRIYGLAEMMNYPAILNEVPDALAMLRVAHQLGKVCDGHFPRGRGEQARKYASFGITSDHECVSADEARDKIAAGMKILIREGSAAKNFDALIELLAEFPDLVMFCSDDLHPDRLYFEGHINLLVARAIRLGHDAIAAIRAATKNPVEHYKLDVGLLREGDPADLIVVEDLSTMMVRQCYIDGLLVAENGVPLQEEVRSEVVNHFNCEPISAGQIAVTPTADHVRVIKILPGELVTDSEVHPVVPQRKDGFCDLGADILKLVVCNRYQPTPPTVAFVRGFGIHSGALASSIAHDSHNVVAVGTSDENIVQAVNAVIEAGGGIALVNEQRVHILPLPVAGLMAAGDGFSVADSYRRLDALAKELGSTLPAPFMTLSFLCLLVIPSLKLSDLGLFDGDAFRFTDLFVNQPL